MNANEGSQTPCSQNRVHNKKVVPSVLVLCINYSDFNPRRPLPGTSRSDLAPLAEAGQRLRRSGVEVRTNTQECKQEPTFCILRIRRRASFEHIH